MSKGSKQQYKFFRINNIDDGLVALSSLIVPATTHLSKYKEYCDEAHTLLKKYKDVQDANPTEEILIPAKEYDDVNDKLLYRQRELLKYLADYQDTSFSYLNLRKTLYDQGYLETTLSDTTHSILKELLDIRNWSFHNAQSLLVAENEAAQKKIPDELKEFISIRPQLSPIIIPLIINYDIGMLTSLTLHAENKISQFNTILQSMKADYTEMYNKSPSRCFILVHGKPESNVVYTEMPKTVRLEGYQTDIIQLSMGIQKSKYDGSKDSYERLTLNHK